MNLWRVRVLVVLLALRAVLQLLPADVADAERHAVETALLFVPETARVLATAGVLVVAAICVPDVPVAPAVATQLQQLVWVVLVHAIVHALAAITHVLARAMADAPLAEGDAMIIVRADVTADVYIHVALLAETIAPIHVRGLVPVDARIHVRAVEALALTTVRDALAAVLVVVLVLDAPRVPALVLDVTDVVTNALPHVSSPVPDVPGAVPVVHRAVQVASLLVVTLVPEHAVMAALTHAVRVALPVQRIVLQTAERLARAHATEA